MTWDNSKNRAFAFTNSPLSKYTLIHHNQTKQTAKEPIVDRLLNGVPRDVNDIRISISTSPFFPNFYLDSYPHTLLAFKRISSYKGISFTYLTI